MPALRTAHPSSEVLVPIVGRSGQAGTLARIAIGDTLPPRLDPEDTLRRDIAQLFDYGLYQAAAHALAASRSLLLARRKRYLGLGPRILPVCSLDIGNPGELRGLSAENARSAELGLAIAGLIGASRKGGRVVATGALDLSGPTRRVAPIGQLADKLDLLLDRASAGEGSSLPDVPELMFVPEHDLEGTLTADTHANAIHALAERGITVCPVATLDAVLDHLDLGEVRETPGMRLARWAVGATALAAALAFFASIWMRQPVDLDWMPVALPDGQLAIGPFATDLSPTTLACPQDGPLPRHPDGTTLRIVFTIGSGAETSVHFLGGYAFAVIGITLSEQPEVRVYRPGRLSPGDDLAVDLPIVGHPTRNVIGVIARRGFGFDPASLQARISRRLTVVGTGLTPNAARNAILAESQWALTHLFVGGGDPGLC